MFKPVEANPNFPEMERKLLDHWYKDGIVAKYLQKNKSSKKTFSFLDGPITANNPMGVHHAWGRTYKDLWPKFFNLLGYRQRFQNGFDCQGLWVEVEVEKELKLRTKKDIENLVPGDTKASIAKFVQLCKDRVKKFSGIQTEQSKRLGYFADWDHSYFTMSDDNNYMIWHFLKVCFENGWVYKGHESVPWCPRCETAISQHEMLTEDYKELVHESIIIEFPIVDRKNEYLLVWTTTPWTIPANIAVAVDEKADYALVEGNNGELFWVAKDRADEVFKVHKVYKVLKVVKGKELVGLKYSGPFDDIPAVKKVAEANPKTFHTVVATDPLIMPISTTEGTGLVHTAVSAGTEDFLLGKKLGLPMIPVIADNADYIENLGFLTGKNAKKHPEIILDYLKNEQKGKFVFSIFKYKHRYPACWRCKAELVWKVADEWYISMDSPSRNQNSKFKNQNLTLRERMIEVAKKIKWMPEFGLERELDWLKNMHDWLISKKNRYWGLALPIYECKKCDAFEVIGSKEELEKRAIKGWDEFKGHSPHKPYIDEVKIKCQKCDQQMSRISDVGNPWLDAGIVPYSTLSDDNTQPLYLNDRKGWQEWFPVDFITESFPGQFKNWFYAMIAMSTVLENTNPFERVLGFATMVGEDGRPMHKSWGNYIEFNEAADKIGVDVMRWLYCRQNPADNLPFGYKKTDEVRRQFYLMLWNVYKFFVEYANLDKFQNPNSKIQANSKSQKPKYKNILDIWIVNRLNWLIDFGEKNLREFNVKDFALEVEKFVSDLSTWYIRRSRDRIWVNSEDENDRQSFYNTLYRILVDLSIILSPIMPFISDKIYTSLTGDESVHLSSWPIIDHEEKVNFDLINDMESLRKLVEAGHRVRKETKIKVKQPLALVSFQVPTQLKFSLSELSVDYEKLLAAELNVKKVKIKYEKSDNLEIKVEYDTQLTDDLIKEGKIRLLVREIQELRKKMGKNATETVELTLPEEFAKEKEYFQKRVLAKNIRIGESLKVE